MSKIVITTYQNVLLVDFGEYAGMETHFGVVPKKKLYQKHNIEFTYDSNNNVIANLIEQATEWYLSYTNVSNKFKVDSIDGSEPSSDSDLFDKLSCILTTDSIGNNKNSNKVAGSTSSTLLVAINKLRSGLIIKNNTNKTVWINTENPAVLGDGFDLYPGDIHFDDIYKGAYYMISESGVSGNINVIEII